LPAEGTLTYDPNQKNTVVTVKIWRKVCCMETSALEPGDLGSEIFCTADLSPVPQFPQLSNGIDLSTVTVSKTYAVDRVEESNMCKIFMENQKVNVNINVETGLHKYVVGI
jgi:hypothetical protein